LVPWWLPGLIAILNPPVFTLVRDHMYLHKYDWYSLMWVKGRKPDRNNAYLPLS
jgi:hypothetical protein